MDETRDNDGDEPKATGAARAKRRSRPSPSPSGKTLPPKKKRGPAPVRDTAPPRRWWEQPWLWFGTIVATVIVALGVSFAVNTDPEDVEPTGDTAAFCAALQTYRQVAPQIDIGTIPADDQFERVPGAFAAVQATAPPEIRSTIDDLAARNIQATVDGLRQLRSQPDSLDRVRQAEELLTSIDQRTKRSSDRFERYARRACAIELGQAPPSTAPASTTTAPVASSVTAPTAPLTTPASGPSESAPSGAPSPPSPPGASAVPTSVLNQ